MNETRRKEIEQIIERLEAEKALIRQISVADALAKHSGYRINTCITLMDETIHRLEFSIKGEQEQAST